MSLLRVLIVKNSHILAEIHFGFHNKRPRSNLNSFQYQIWASVKDQESSYQGRQVLGLFGSFRLKLCQRR